MEMKKKTAKPNPKISPHQKLPSLVANSLLTQNQLVDSLTAHISLYHSHTFSPNPNPNPRSSIVKWFASLTVHQRQSHLTAVDHGFAQLLLQMLAKLRSNGHGRFIILPDLPSTSSSRGLPGLCFKKSRGLLSRTAESNACERVIFDSVLLFSSKEGEKVEGGCSCCGVATCLDSVTVREEFVDDVERFVDVMDGVSNGGFLRGEESELGSDWVELEWLKARGYYGIEAFVANRLEVAMRLAWINSGNGKKRGVKLKEKVAMAGVAANVFWRKKGCVDWWRNLDADTRRKFVNAAVGKFAKSLTCEILKEVNGALEDELWLFKGGAVHPLRYMDAELLHRNILKLSADAEFGSGVVPASLSGKAASLANAFNSLFVLRDIVSLIVIDQQNECDISKILFSTLGSVNTISDYILRKLRGLVMATSLDCTKLELLEEGNFKSLPNKPKEKLGAGGHRKKVKNRNIKKPNTLRSISVNESTLGKTLKDREYGSAYTENMDSMQSDEMSGSHGGKEVLEDLSSPRVEMEHSQGLVLGKGRTAAKKNRKGKNKSKISSNKYHDEVRNSEGSVVEVPCSSVISLEEATKSDWVCYDSVIQIVSNDNIDSNIAIGSIQNLSDENADGDLTVASDTRLSSSVNEPTSENTDARGSREDNLVGCAKEISEIGATHHQACNSQIEEQAMPSRIESISSKVDSDVVSQVVPALELEDVAGNGDINSKNQETEVISYSANKGIETLDVKEESTLIKGQEGRNYYDTRVTSSAGCLSYEWPSLTPVYFPSTNSHLLPATDRLHLDVGHNWHNHLRQPFVATVHQARNSPVEGGCNLMLSQPLPMSLDWPPMVRSSWGLAPSMTCNYDTGFISRRQSAFHQSFTSQSMPFNPKFSDDERKYSGDSMDLAEAINAQELTDECESHWISEEEFEVHAVSGVDYNQYFGGGVMYWNPSDHAGTGFSRPPSLSSDDSSWAWHEADMNRAVDDMVAFSSSYSTNGLTSPTAASFCSPFDPLAPGHQALGYVVSGNEVPGKVLHSSSPATDAVTENEVSGSLAKLSGDVEGKVGDSLPYPILRPIVIPNMSRDRTSKRSHDHKSPCVPPARREQPRIKRPPSPVVLCVPRAPRPPPPSPVSSDSRKNRGFPTVRSGSSSPRHWGMRGWHHDGTNMEEACVRMDGTEVAWPSWRNKNLSTHPMIQPPPGAILQDRLIAMSQLGRDQEHPDASFPLQPLEPQNCPTRKASLSLVQSLLHDEIDFFCKQVAAANMAQKPFINWAVKRVTRSLQVLWPRSRTNIFGSNATGLSLPTSDVDLVVCLPPVRNLEPIKEAGILEGRNGIKETCLQHAARYLANQEWVKNDSLKTVENTMIPIIMLVVEVPSDLITATTANVHSPKEELIQMTGEHENQSHMVSSEDSVSPKYSQINYNSMKDVKSVRLDISFKSPSHTGLQTTEMVKELTDQFPAVTPLALVLKQFLADRSLDQSYSGGLSSYCLVLLITRFLQHEHHLGRPINQNLGSLLMDFLYFFGNVFDPRQMRISVRGSGVYVNRERGYSIDPIHIDDPLFPTNNVGRNCFRIHQCIKAFSEAYSILESEITRLPEEDDTCSSSLYRLLSKIIPSINLLEGVT